MLARISPSRIASLAARPGRAARTPEVRAAGALGIEAPVESRVASAAFERARRQSGRRRPNADVRRPTAQRTTTAERAYCQAHLCPEDNVVSHVPQRGAHDGPSAGRHHV